MQHVFCTDPHPSVMLSRGFMVIRSQSRFDRSRDQVNRPQGSSKCTVGTMNSMNHFSLKWVCYEGNVVKMKNSDLIV